MKTLLELFVESRILVYLARHTEGVPAALITAWLRSIRKYDITIQETEAGLRRLRDEGLVACANGVWYRRELKKA